MTDKEKLEVLTKALKEVRLNTFTKHADGVECHCSCHNDDTWALIHSIITRALRDLEIKMP